MNAILRCTLATLVLIGFMTASQAPASAAKSPLKSGELIVEDKAKFFSSGAVQKAKDDFAILKSANERRVAIYTIDSLPEDAKAQLRKLGTDKEKYKFWEEFAIKLAESEHKPDIFILICRSPAHVKVMADETMRKSGFAQNEETRIARIFGEYFEEAAGKPAAEATALHDKALLKAVSELHAGIPITTDESHKQGHAVGHEIAKPQKEGMGIMGYVCIGLAILAGVWLIFGVIRAFSGGGGGGGYGGGMGGGGGGGFMSSLMGGLFGSMAGMWLYDNLMGGHTSSAFGGDTSGNNYDSGGGPADEPGQGDFSGDQGGDADFGGGDSGGGDNGGGGDWGGGGGDFGGGGGDFGGGGGDF